MSENNNSIVTLSNKQQEHLHKLVIAGQKYHEDIGMAILLVLAVGVVLFSAVVIFAL